MRHCDRSVLKIFVKNRGLKKGPFWGQILGFFSRFYLLFTKFSSVLINLEASMIHIFLKKHVIKPTQLAVQKWRTLLMAIRDKFGHMYSSNTYVGYKINTKICVKYNLRNTIKITKKRLKSDPKKDLFWDPNFSQKISKKFVDGHSFVFFESRTCKLHALAERNTQPR